MTGLLVEPGGAVIPKRSTMSETLERRTRLGKYEIMEQLGVGGMATVYKAKNAEDGSPVAIKVPDRRLLSSVRALQQFKREGQALIRLRHPNIVRVHSVGQQNDMPYIVMDYVDGHALAQEIESKGKFSVDEVVELLRPIADALDYIHSEKTFHCDVKPGNIRLYRGRTPVLVDFGIVQTTDGTVWDEGKPTGSVWYMSPEQARGERASAYSDQYSLGVAAYEMLAGNVPFDGDNPYTIVLQQRDAKPGIPRDWGEPLKGVMKRVLDKDPRLRFSSCFEFVRALQAANREPALAVQPPVKVTPDDLWTVEPVPSPRKPPDTRDRETDSDSQPHFVSDAGGPAQQVNALASTSRRTALYIAAAVLGVMVLAVGITVLLVRHRGGQAHAAVPAPGVASPGVPQIISASLRFFGSTNPQVPPEPRKYEAGFDLSLARFVNSEIDLKYQISRSATVEVAASLYDPEGKLVSQQAQQIALAAGPNEVRPVMTWGSEGRGYWKPGIYKCEFNLGQSRVIESSFVLHDRNKEVVARTPSPSSLNEGSRPPDTSVSKQGSTQSSAQQLGQPGTQAAPISNAPPLQPPVRSIAPAAAEHGGPPADVVTTSKPVPATAAGVSSPPVSLQPVTLSPAATMAAPPKPADHSGFVPAHLEYKVNPIFPSQATNRSYGIGAMEVTFTVGKDGRVKNPKVVKGPWIFQDSAKNCVLQWRYSPALLDGVPVEQELTVKFLVHLD